MNPRAAVALALLLLAGCGGDSEPAASQRSDRLVDFSAKPPYVNSFVRDADGELLLTTNRGFFRIDPESDELTQVEGNVTAEGKRAPIGTFLEIDRSDDGALVGSGHPDSDALPQFLGLIRSEDGGRNWTSVSRLGDADLHKIVFAHDRLYAFDAVLGAILISEDDGKTFTEHFTPRDLIVDFVVDPADPEHILATGEERAYRSTDSGDTWRPHLDLRGIRLAWPEADRLYVATADGEVQTSSDGGKTLTPAGKLPGAPAVLDAVSRDEVYAALEDGTVTHTEDGGETWHEVFSP